MKKLVIYSLFLFTGIVSHAQTKYFPLGDSYTICEGLEEKDRWPNLVVQQLQKEGRNILLSANPARTGYTTQDLIRFELPLLKTQKPDVVTLLIGVNDYVQGVDTSTFHANLAYILDAVQAVIPNKRNIIIITIPDYSVTPQGLYYTGGRDVNTDLKTWNLILNHEARKRQLGFVDIFDLTCQMKNDPSLVGKDGLHPSAKEVALWAELITPEVNKLLNASK